MLPLQQVLEAVAGQPLTPHELARRLGSAPGAIEGMLLTLERGHYVTAAQPDAPSCQCGPCSLKSLCRNANDSGTPLPLLRLTPRGERYLARAAQTNQAQ